MLTQDQTQMMNGITSHCSHSVVPIVPTSLLVRVVLAVACVNGGLKMPVASEEGGEFIVFHQIDFQFRLSFNTYFLSYMEAFFY